MPAINFCLKQTKVTTIGPERIQQNITLKRQNVCSGSFPSLNNSANNKKRRLCVAGSSDAFIQNENCSKCDTAKRSVSTRGQVSGTNIFYDNDDLTNLNWLQDANLLKNFYSTEIGSGSVSRTNRNQPETKFRRTIFVRPTDHFVDYDQPICKPFKSKTNFLNYRPYQQSQQRLHQQQLPQRQVSIKPPYSYSALIYMAIESSPTKSMMVRDIYKWIVNRFPYFATAPPGWKNTIRHTLSLRKYFKKMEKLNSSIGMAETAGSSDSDSDKDSNSLDIKGGYWYVDLDYKLGLQQLVDRVELNTIPKLMVRNVRQFEYANRVCHLNLHKVPFLLPVNLTRLSNDYGTHIAINQHKMVQNGVNVRKNFIHVPVISSAKQQDIPPTYSTTNKTIGTNSIVCSVNSMQSKDVKRPANQLPLKLQLKIDKIYSQKNNQMYGHAKQLSPRNDVSVISVNQTPKVYAPVPIVRMGDNNAQSEQTFRQTTSQLKPQPGSNKTYTIGNPIRNVCQVGIRNCVDSLTNNLSYKLRPNNATRESERKRARLNINWQSDGTGVSNGQTAAAALSTAVPSLIMKTSTERNINDNHRGTTFQSQINSSNISIKAATSQNSALSNLAGKSDFDDCHLRQHSGSNGNESDSDDDLILDGAQALLNFATGVFELNCLIKQED